MSNNSVLILQTLLGKEITNSPSAVSNWLRPIFTLVEKGHIIAEYTVRQEMTNAAGKLHGGIIACIIDDLMGTTVFTLDRDFFMSTINLSIDYLFGGQLGDVVLAHCEITREGKNIVNVTCKLYNKATQKLIAHGTSNLVTTSTPKIM